MSVVALLFAAGTVRGWADWLPNWSNPFGQETTDRSGPVLLRSIQDLSRFTAASGNFEVIIDVETGQRFIPDFLVSERVLFVAAGTVDAYVEFGGLAEGAVEVDEQANSVAVTLPEPDLAKPNLDHERSYVYSVQRGAGNRILDFFDGDSSAEQEVFGLAEERLIEAAAESELRQRAQSNTEQMLVGMLSSLGFDEVTITFEEGEPAPD
ncbi:DUF4230 domain-containing protein [Natronosporangium hydrolyticum]|uniref:DUF4230 domain-containing protein n=1 Tax=Natronosporangium hydrolyticum TaxID=2811111 RepID=UPI001EFA2189|nr:DUF4230 domain-containing protein [Natronosporangium hydrolyticum]